jgi:SAM-dependent methyltransferase
MNMRKYSEPYWRSDAVLPEVQCEKLWPLKRKRMDNPNATLLKSFALSLLVPKGMAGFLNSVVKNGKLLDVGCGNQSPFRIKAQRPDVFYVGLDIGDYNQSANCQRYADQYIITSPELFDAKIVDFPDSFDAVISSHNLEHCDQPEKTLRAILASLKRGGRLYLSFPCEDSISFPSRNPLNFFDDPTHTHPPEFNHTVEAIRSAGFNIEFVAKRYRPPIPFLLGLLLEPLGYLLKRNMPVRSTWALYGFETVIWASRPSS